MHARLFIAAIAVGGLVAFPAAGLAQGGGQRGAQAGGPSGTRGTPTTPTTPAPATARPRDGRPVTGTAVPRTAPSSSPFAVSPSFYSVPPSFYSAQPFSPFHHRRMGVGLGLSGPFYWSNFGYMNYGGYQYAPAPMYDEAAPDVVSSAPFSTYVSPGLPLDQLPPATPTGNLRLVVDPLTAQVFVDGYFVGSVDDFSDTLAGLLLEAGPHHLEFRAPGYDTLVFDVRIEAQRTITYRGALQRRQP